MCGIVGVLGQLNNHESIIQEMMQTIRHRGPDDSGTFFDGKVHFGHQRLAIIDLEHGKQPMVRRNQELAIIYNGEIYNYIELRAELIAKGHTFETESDTEVLLACYEEYGESCLNKLNGMFAFAIYDKKANSVLLARDHFGIKPLYYYADGSRVVFASEIKAILKCPGIPREPDWEAIQQYLTLQFLFGNSTLFKGIQQLEPATTITIHLDTLKPKRRLYWNPSHRFRDGWEEKEIVDQLTTTFDETIEWQLRADVPIGAHLSGGLDSSLITSMAANRLKHTIHTFTGYFTEGIDFDERKHAAAVNDTLNTTPHQILVKPEHLIEQLHDIIYMLDYPDGTPGILPQNVVSRFAKQHVKVVLAGQGGDELFGGYTRYLIAYLEQCLKHTILEMHKGKPYLVTLESILPNLASLKRYTPLLQKFWSQGLFEEMDLRYFQLIDRRSTHSSVLHTDLTDSWDEEALVTKFRDTFNNIDTSSYINKMTTFDMKTLLPALLHMEDRTSMAVSLESRVPLLDHRVVEAVNVVPPTIKYPGGESKYLLKQIAKGLVPDTILERKDKMGFPTPLGKWFNGPAKSFVTEIFNSQSARERGLCDTDQIMNQIDKALPFDRSIWGALCLEIWFQTFID